MKKCRDVNKSGTDLPFIPTDDIESDDTDINKNNIDNEVLKDEEVIEEVIEEESKLNIETLINMTSVNHMHDDDLDVISNNSDFNNF